MDVQRRIARERIPCHALRKRRRNVPLHQGFFAEVGTRSRASRSRLSDNDIRCSASDGRWFRARPAQHVHRRRNNGKGPNTIGTRERAWQKRQKTRRDMQSRTRRSASTIGGAAPDTIIGRADADRAGARPYRRNGERAERQTPNAERRTPNAYTRGAAALTPSLAPLSKVAKFFTNRVASFFAVAWNAALSSQVFAGMRISEGTFGHSATASNPKIGSGWVGADFSAPSWMASSIARVYFSFIREPFP